MYNMVSLAGVGLMMLAAWAFSTDRRVINWRLIGWGVLLQMALALFIFRVEWGALLLLGINDAVIGVLDSAGAGARFVFGRLALPPGAVDQAGQESLGFILAFQALPAIIFFAALVSALYHLGIMPWLIARFAWLFTRLMRVSGAEALSASSNIFVGVESALTIRPYLAGMTRSELCAVLTVGMATVASNVLAAYVFMLKGVFPTIAGHLISASFLSAPAALIMSKLLVPETGQPATLGLDVEPHYERDASLMEAVIRGAGEGMKLILGIAALLIAFLGLLALADSGLGRLGGLVGLEGLSLRLILGYLFYPFTLAVGVPAVDAGAIAGVIGERVVATEFASYMDLAGLISSGALVHERSAFIAAYALCGFAHVASLAIFVGGVSALVPERTRDLADLGGRALYAATLACMMTAAVAGTFYSGGSILLGPN